MLKLNDVMTYIESIAPACTALDFDNVGLILGKRDNEITGILCCLDLTENVIEEAVESGINTIITHHPFIFNPIKRIDEDDVRGILLCKAIRNNLNVYSAHTNWDFARNGVNEALCSSLMLDNVRADNSNEHRYGILKQEMTVLKFVNYVKDKLNSKCVKYILPDTCKNKVIKVVGVSSGSFDEETAWIYENKVDALVTGEVKHSDAIDLKMHNFVTLAAGHYETEVLGMRNMAELISKQFEINVRFSALQKNPFDF